MTPTIRFTRMRRSCKPRACASASRREPLARMFATCRPDAFSEAEIAADLESAGAMEGGDAAFESALEPEGELGMPAGEGGLPPMSADAFDDSDLAQPFPAQPQEGPETGADFPRALAAEAPVEELGAADLLDEEFPAATPDRTGEDLAPLDAAPEPRGGMQPSTLDKIDVE